MTLSVCMIVKDEEETLARCLSCIKAFADEIVVADTGSTDASKEIARAFTDKVFDFPWTDDFSAARNFSFEKASCELVMWLDADDVVTGENAEKIIALKEEMQNYDAAFLKYAAAFDERENPTFYYYRERIFKRNKGFLWQGVVHECIAVSGRILYSDAAIFHKKVKQNPSMRNLLIYQRYVSRGNALNEREKFYYGRELYFNRLYEESAAVLTSFLSGDGWIQNKIEACVTLYRALSALNRGEEGVGFLLKSFSYGLPQREACCLLGGYFFDRADYSSAVHWYRTAIDLPEDEKSGGFVDASFGGYIPNIMLCVLYDRLGDREKAEYYNERAGSFRPDDESVARNREYFRRMKESK